VAPAISQEHAADVEKDGGDHESGTDFSL
jgi:hypothetical protein